jgi:hypothetical protein
VSKKEERKLKIRNGKKEIKLHIREHYENCVAIN